MKNLFANIFSSYTSGSMVDALRRLGYDVKETWANRARSILDVMMKGD